jgi:hypothetical protein
MGASHCPPELHVWMLSFATASEVVTHCVLPGAQAPLQIFAGRPRVFV